MTSCIQATGAALACADSCLVLNGICVATCQSTLANNPTAVSLLTCAVTSGCLPSGGGFCGNGTCSATETPLTCPLDCKTVCGDGKCALPETQLTCAKDCKPIFPACGDGNCAATESAKSCPFDCDSATKKIYSCVKGICPAQTAACLKLQSCETAVLAGVSCAVQCKKGDLTCLTQCGSKTAGNAAATAVVSCGLSCFL